MAQEYHPIEVATGIVIILFAVFICVAAYVYWPVTLVLLVLGGTALWWWKGPTGNESRRHDEQRKLYAQATQAIAARQFSDADDFATETIQHLKDSARCPHFNVLFKLYKVTSHLYGAEQFNTISEPPPIANSIEGARWRDETRILIAKVSTPGIIATFQSTLLESYRWFADRLPDVAIQTAAEVSAAADAFLEDRPTATFMLTLMEVHPRPQDLIEELVKPTVYPVPSDRSANRPLWCQKWSTKGPRYWWDFARQLIHSEHATPQSPGTLLHPE